MVQLVLDRHGLESRGLEFRFLQPLVISHDPDLLGPFHVGQQVGEAQATFPPDLPLAGLEDPGLEEAKRPMVLTRPGGPGNIHDQATLQVSQLGSG